MTLHSIRATVKTAYARARSDSIRGLYYGPAKVLVSEPCPLGLPERLTVVHMELAYGTLQRIEGVVSSFMSAPLFSLKPLQGELLNGRSSALVTMERLMAPSMKSLLGLLPQRLYVSPVGSPESFNKLPSKMIHKASGRSAVEMQ